MDLENRYKEYCTVQQLLDFIEKHKLPKDAKILVQRVEDVYYEGVDISGFSGADTPNGIFPPGSKTNGWETYKKEGEDYYHAKEINEKIDSGEFSNEENYPNIENPEDYRISPEDMEKLKDQYTPVFCPVWYNDEKHLFLNLHY
jgi:hypothetical protein